MSEQGCTYREHKNAQTCNKLCDPPHNLCPHHKLLTESQEAEKERQAKAREQEKKQIVRRLRR